MKPSSWILGAIATVIIGPSAGCDRGAPTEPGRGLANIEKGPVTSSAADLAGNWSGTITFPPDSTQDGGDENIVPPCDGPHATTAILVESGNSLTGQLSSCAGVLEMHGVINEANISGTLVSAAGHDYGRITGTAASNRIQFKTILKTADLDDPEGNDGDEEPLTLTEVDLQRSMQRGTPFVVVDRSRSPRPLPTRR
jgi:hypothetical protein